jgi:hypothetical protein
MPDWVREKSFNGVHGVDAAMRRAKEALIKAGPTQQNVKISQSDLEMLLHGCEAWKNLHSTSPFRARKA